MCWWFSLVSARRDRCGDQAASETAVTEFAWMLRHKLRSSSPAALMLRRSKPDQAGRSLCLRHRPLHREAMQRCDSRPLERAADRTVDVPGPGPPLPAARATLSVACAPHAAREEVRVDALASLAE